MFERVGLIGVELEEDVTVDGGAMQRGGRVQPAGTGQLALFLGFLVDWGLLGDGGRYAAFVLAHTKRQHEVAHVFAVDGQPAQLHADGPRTLKLEGGTHNPLAPPFEFIDRVFLPIQAQIEEADRGLRVVQLK